MQRDALRLSSPLLACVARCVLDGKGTSWCGRGACSIKNDAGPRTPDQTKCQCNTSPEESEQHGSEGNTEGHHRFPDGG